jgi:hypothetical protein
LSVVLVHTLNMVQPDQHVWLRLLDTEIGIVENILARLSPRTRANLRAANRASRQLVNSCVTGVRIRVAPRPTTKLADIFPNVDRLELENVEPLWDVARLASSSSEFLGKLHTLQISSRSSSSLAVQFNTLDCHALLPR